MMDKREEQFAVSGPATKWTRSSHPTNRLRALLAIVIPMFLPAVAPAETRPACSPSGTALSIAAKDRRFDKDCLAAPADQPFTIVFDNQDSSVPHNVAIYDRTNGKRPLFKGEVIIGPDKITYSVAPQASGTYEFQCEPHDFTMTGMFIVGDGKAAAPPSGTPRSSTTETTAAFGLP